MRTSASRRISTTPITSRPTRNPIPMGIIPSGPSMSITAWAPTPIRRPIELILRDLPGNMPKFRGLFKTPSMRGADKRPSPDFVKAYMHNGVFKSLKDVIPTSTTSRTLRSTQMARRSLLHSGKALRPVYTPLFPPPEVLNNVQNVTGVPPSQATSATRVRWSGRQPSTQLSTESYHLMTEILSDGYTKPNPVSP